MLVSCWSAKGGSGTTVVAAALATVLGRRGEAALVVDVGGDLPVVLGVPRPDGPGLTEWLAAGAAVPADALARLEVPVRPGLHLLPRGADALGHPDRAEVLAAVLAGDPRPVVIDVGVVTATGGPAAECARVLAASASRSLLVTRSCFLAISRARDLPLRPSGVVLLTERGRALGRPEVEDVLGAPVLAEVPVLPEVARAADSGLLGRRVPRSLERSLRRAA